MKVAVCLSGHSRNYLYNFPNYSFECDAFISSCDESGLPGESTERYVSYHSQNNVKTELASTSDIITKYQPLRHEFLPDSYFPKELEKFRESTTENGAFLIHFGMMFYRIYRANLLKKEHEFSNNFKYDLVIRSRFDVKINSNKFDQDVIYMLTHPDNSVLDIFFASSSYVMDSISECYLWFISQPVEYLRTFKNAESIFAKYLSILNLNLSISKDFNITFNKDYPIEVKNFKNGIMTIL